MDDQNHIEPAHVSVGGLEEWTGEDDEPPPGLDGEEVERDSPLTDCKYCGRSPGPLSRIL